MIRAMSTYAYVKDRLHPGMLDGLVRGGAQAVELFCARQHFDYSSRQHVTEIAAWFKSNPVPLHSIHAPLFTDEKWGQAGGSAVNIAAIDRRERVEAVDEIKRALEVAEVMPFRYMTVQTGKFGEAFDERKFEATMSCIEHLRTFARPLGVQLLLENIPNELATPQKLMELIHTLHFDDLNICFDVGHAHMTGEVAVAFATLRDHVRSVHLHDNAGERDSHLWPGAGTVDWDEAMKLVRAAPQPLPLLLEVSSEEGEDVPARMTEAYNRLEAAGGNASA